jgi:hypothetical protein
MPARWLLSALAALALLGVEPATAAQLAASSTGGRLSGNYTNAEIFPNLQTALRIARTHSVLVISQCWQLGVDGTWDGTVADTYFHEMKARNPRLVIFRYLNAVYDTEAGFPESWYMHNGAGHRLYNGTWKTYLMDPRSTAPFTRDGVTSRGWVDYLANLFRRDAARCPRVFNGGAWLDDVGGTPHVVDALTGIPSTPVKDSSGAPWGVGEWYRLTTGVVARVRAAIGGFAAGNALLSGTCYFTGCGGGVPTRTFFGRRGVQLAMAEGWLRSWWDPPDQHAAKESWQRDIQMVLDASRRRRAIHVITALPPTASAEQVAKWRLYAYASFLVANRGRAYFQFVPSSGVSSRTAPFEMAKDLYSLNLGAPIRRARFIRAYARRNGRYYERLYRRGRVFVNPSNTAVKVALGGRFKLPNGAAVVSITLSPHSGQIVLGQVRVRLTPRARPTRYAPSRVRRAWKHLPRVPRWVARRLPTFRIARG